MKYKKMYMAAIRDIGDLRDKVEDLETTVDRAVEALRFFGTKQVLPKVRKYKAINQHEVVAWEAFIEPDLRMSTAMSCPDGFITHCYKGKPIKIRKVGT